MNDRSYWVKGTEISYEYPYLKEMKDSIQKIILIQNTSLKIEENKDSLSKSIRVLESPSKDFDGTKEQTTDVSRFTLPSFYKSFSNKEITTLSPNEIINSIKSVKSSESINTKAIMDIIKTERNKISTSFLTNSLQINIGDNNDFKSVFDNKYSLSELK